MPPKEIIIKLLEESNYPKLVEIAGKDKGIFRVLISLTYNKDELICWRAIEAVGIIAGELVRGNPGVVRNLAQRLLWMMRDESGNNPWGAPDMLGEIVRNSPEEFPDIAPIILSFHDEEILRRGVLRAIARIGEKSRELVKSASLLVEQYLKHDDAVVRAYAALIAGILGVKEFIPAVEALLNDGSAVRIYRDGRLEMFTVRKIAEETVIMLRTGDGC